MCFLLAIFSNVSTYMSIKAGCPWRLFFSSQTQKSLEKKVAKELILRAVGLNNVTKYWIATFLFLSSVTQAGQLFWLRTCLKKVLGVLMVDFFLSQLWWSCTQRCRCFFFTHMKGVPLYNCSFHKRSRTKTFKIFFLQLLHTGSFFCCCLKKKRRRNEREMIQIRFFFLLYTESGLAEAWPRARRGSFSKIDCRWKVGGEGAGGREEIWGREHGGSRRKREIGRKVLFLVFFSFFFF